DRERAILAAKLRCAPNLRHQPRRRGLLRRERCRAPARKSTSSAAGGHRRPGKLLMTPQEFGARLAKNGPEAAYLFLGPEAYERDRAKRALLDSALGADDRESGLTR